MWRLLALLLLGAPPVLAQVVSPPEMLGVIAGPGATVEPPGVRFYGTDLGWTFEHRGTHYMLFGDTWPHERSPCDALPHNDDSLATFPLELPAKGVPTLTVTTDPDAPSEFARIRLFHDGDSAVMGYNKTPLTAFSDGTDAVTLFGLIDLVRCRPGRRRERPSCRPYEHLACSQEVGICAPPLLGYDAPCDLATGAGCILGQACEPTRTGICIDPQSSQYDGTTASLPATAAYHTHIGFQDADRPSDCRHPLRPERHRRVHARRRRRRPRRPLDRVGVEPVPGRAAADERPARRRRAGVRPRCSGPGRSIPLVHQLAAHLHFTPLPFVVQACFGPVNVATPHWPVGAFGGSRTR